MKIMASGPITSWQIDGEIMETVAGFIFLGSRITADDDCSHEIKGYLLLGRKAMTNLDSILKSRDITLLLKVCIVKVIVFPLVMYECESWTIKKAECWRWCFQTVMVEKTLESPLDSKKIKSIRFPKGNQSWIFIGMAECWSWSSNILATWCEEPTYFKRPWCWNRMKAGAEGWMASLTQ